MPSKTNHPPTSSITLCFLHTNETMPVFSKAQLLGIIPSHHHAMMLCYVSYIIAQLCQFNSKQRRVKFSV